ncbi:MAG: ABC transporter permease [Chloroflexi bacterium]|nr:ABC transporter permease [Chloroflexota bacterium]
MLKYCLRRLLLFIPVVFGAATLIFGIMQVLPGDVALVILGAGGEGAVTPEALARLREQLGLDRPIYEQYLSWLWGMVRFDLGKSLWSGEPIIHELAMRIPLSFELVVLGTLISTSFAIPVGVISAIRQDAAPDYVVRIFAYAGQAMPGFWVAILLILFLVRLFQWLPPLGYVNLFEDPGKNLQILIWPALVLGVRHAAISARMTRSCVLEVMREDYIRTAWAKGLAEKTVLIRHTLKNAMLPVITIIAMEFSYLFGALIVIETVFTLPGMGRFLVDAIYHRDIPVVQVIIVVIALLVAVVNLLTDMLYAWLDPRIRYA